MLIMLSIIAVCCIVVGYFYITEKYFNHENTYTWVIIFFGSQVLSFFFIDMIVILFVTLMVTRSFRLHRVCLARTMRDSLFAYEDFKYILEFSKPDKTL